MTSEKKPKKSPPPPKTSKDPKIVIRVQREIKSIDPDKKKP
jgi:hypothetical protein